MSPTFPRQQDRAAALLKERGMVRLSEFIAEGITAATISRMEQKDLILQLSRGLYQLPDAPLDANHSLAEVAKLIPRGVICMDSALAFHELTDRIPPRIWVAIGSRDWRPQVSQPPVAIMRFGPKSFDSGRYFVRDFSRCFCRHRDTIFSIEFVEQSRSCLRGEQFG